MNIQETRRTTTIKGAVLASALSIVIGFGLGLPIQAEEDLKVGGHIYGGYNTFGLGRNTSFQNMDLAVNLDIEKQINKRVGVGFQLQTSPGNGFHQFPGPGAALTDAYMTFQYNPNLLFLMGSFDTPFGQEVPALTNNANTFSNHFIYNSLLYAALAGPMGTLNTIGASTTVTVPNGEVTVALTNGTSEDSGNTNATFEGVVRGVVQAHETTTVGLSFLSDSGKDEGGFQADLSGVMADAKVNLNRYVTITAYIAQMTYNDQNGSTKDKVHAGMIEISQDFGGVRLSGRVSSWTPEDSDADGTGISKAIQDPGMRHILQGTTGTALDEGVLRYQISLSMDVDPAVRLKGEVFIDDYQSSPGLYNAVGLLIGTNVAF